MAQTTLATTEGRTTPRVNHIGACATRGGADDTRGSHEGARNAHVHHTERWSIWASHTSQRGDDEVATTRDNEDNTRGVEQLGLTHTETRRDAEWTTWT